MTETKAEYVRTPSVELVAEAKALWGQHGCTCAPVDNGVGVQHEPYCGDPRPEDVAEFAFAYAASERAALDAAKLRVKILERDLNTIGNKVAALVQRLDEDDALLDGYAKNEPPIVSGALDAQAAAERALFAERRKVVLLRETVQWAALEFPHIGVLQHVLKETE